MCCKATLRNHMKMVSHLFFMSLFFTNLVGVSINPIIIPEGIVIREIKESDFSKIPDLGVSIFSDVYNDKSTEKISYLRKAHTSIAQEDYDFFISHSEGMIGLVAEHEEGIIGILTCNLLSQEEIYIRNMMIETKFQKKGLGLKMLQLCHQAAPTIKRAYCATNKKNIKAQNMYKLLGGQSMPIQDPIFEKFLYKCLDHQTFVGYEFDENAIRQFLLR